LFILFNFIIYYNNLSMFLYSNYCLLFYINSFNINISSINNFLIYINNLDYNSILILMIKINIKTWLPLSYIFHPP